MTDQDNITQIGIARFLELVIQTGTECLKQGKEDYMGEARERMKMGLAPRMMKPGEQIQVGPEVLKHAVEKTCSCGGKFFVPAVQVSTISALVSPVGQEMTLQVPVLVCMDCKKPLNLKGDALGTSEPTEGKENPHGNL